MIYYIQRARDNRFVTMNIIYRIKRGISPMKEKSFLIIKCLTNIMFFCGIPATIAVPFVLRWYGKVINSYYEKYYILQTILFVICGIFSCLIIYQLKMMIGTIEKDDCFVMDNVVSLKKMGIYAYIIALACLTRMFLYWTPGAFALVIVFTLAGLLSNVLAGVFKKAVEYKLENDMTI